MALGLLALKLGSSTLMQHKCHRRTSSIRRMAIRDRVRCPVPCVALAQHSDEMLNTCGGKSDFSELIGRSCCLRKVPVKSERF